MIMPGFGVQLEQHFWSGRVHRQFVPIGKILKPVLNECVTPVTCYWSLALLVRDEDKITLVCKKLHPKSKCWSQSGKLYVHSQALTALLALPKFLGQTVCTNLLSKMVIAHGN